MEKNKNSDTIEGLNQAVEQVAKKQESDLVIDFDAAVKEEEHFTIRFEGRDYTLPTSPSAKMVLFLTRHNNAVPDDKIISMLDLMFGKDFSKALEQSDHSLASITKLILNPVLTKWGLGGAKYVDNQKAGEDGKKKKANPES